MTSGPGLGLDSELSSGLSVEQGLQQASPQATQLTPQRVTRQASQPVPQPVSQPVPQPASQAASQAVLQHLQAQTITSENFAPYGWVAQAEGQTGRLINGGNSLRVDAVDSVGALALTAAGGTPCLAVFRAQARNPSGPWTQLERHRLGTQTFVPLGGARYLVLVALGDPAPQVNTLAAFWVAGHQAVTLRASTWHHGLIAPEGGAFVVLERAAAAVDCDTVELSPAVRVADAG